MKSYYFISGLPRSGSTLLSAILRQNPEFYADIASPVASPVEALTGSSIDIVTGAKTAEEIYYSQSLKVTIST